MHPFDAITFHQLPPKPRPRAATSILDKGLGPDQVRDLLAVAGEWIDVSKLGWASARLTNAEALRQKVRIYKSAGVRVCTGGTFLEVAFAQERADAFLDGARDLEVDIIEVSNGSHPMTDVEKRGLITQSRDRGFVVWSEVGKKDAEEDARLTIDERISEIERDLSAGAERVILEARESGTVGIYDRLGRPSVELLERVVDRVGVEKLVFEAPQKDQQVWLIRRFGPSVNLGNVQPSDALALATLRTGLRSDTFVDFHLAGTDVYTALGTNGAIEARERGGIIVLVDALRASATIVTALAAGMASVNLVSLPEQCVGDVTAGERGGKKLPHVRHSNSPTELLRESYRGRELVLTTTNAAEVMLTAIGPGTELLVGTTLNARAVAAVALSRSAATKQPITLLMAGRNNAEAPEDSLAAGEIFHAMRGVRLHGPALPAAPALEAAFFASPSGQNLAALGYSEDIRFCAQRDIYDVVPQLRNGLLVPFRP
jgi:phosphosulfolactate synthase (CoM biosynthesis protein A)/phosphosulfolactate phosphohydrolase-like enzyme